MVQATSSAGAGAGVRAKPLWDVPDPLHRTRVGGGGWQRCAGHSERATPHLGEPAAWGPDVPSSQVNTDARGRDVFVAVRCFVRASLSLCDGFLVRGACARRKRCGDQRAAKREQRRRPGRPRVWWVAADTRVRGAGARAERDKAGQTQAAR